MTLHVDDRRRKLESVAFLALVLVTTALFAWMIRAFILPVFWAAVFVVLFQRIHTHLLAVCGGRRTPAALLATLTVVLFVVLPFALVLGALAQQGLLLYQAIASGEINVHGPIDMIERSLPAVAEFLARYGVDIAQLRVAVQDVAAAATQFIAARALAAGQDALWVTLLFALMVYLLFFFFRDGERIVAGAARVLPLGEDRGRRLLLKFAQVARATVKGNLIIAVVQGGLGALLFWIVGIETAVFWGVVMAVLSLLPAVGAGLVWLPAALILFAGGQIWQGALVLLGGVFVISVVDYVLRPIVVGRDTKMPDYLILISTFGGLAVFGLAGFVAGPVIAALFLVVWELFAEEYTATVPLRPPQSADGGAATPAGVPDEITAIADTSARRDGLTEPRPAGAVAFRGRPTKPLLCGASSFSTSPIGSARYWRSWVRRRVDGQSLRRGPADLGEPGGRRHREAGGDGRRPRRPARGSGRARVAPAASVLLPRGARSSFR